MSSLKAVLLNNVVVGKGYKMHQNNETLTAPPKGYDSVDKFKSPNSDLGPDAAKMVSGPWGNKRNFEPRRTGGVH